MSRFLGNMDLGIGKGFRYGMVAKGNEQEVNKSLQILIFLGCPSEFGSSTEMSEGSWGNFVL